MVGIASSLFYGSMEYYKKLGLQYVDVPAIVGITGACENVDTLFKVGNRLDLPLFFTQTGQLALEQVLQSSHGVYTVIHSGRDEAIEDERHLRQFRLTEEEFDCTLANMDRDHYDEEKMYQALLIHIEKATKAMVASVLEHNKRILSSTYNRDSGALEEMLARPYLRIDYADAVKLLQSAGFTDVRFGSDLRAEHEATIIALVNGAARDYGKTIEHWSPVFIMRYPKDIKFFNMKVSSVDPRVVLSADCIFPYAGEAVGAAVREHDGVKLLVRLLTSSMYRLHEQRGGSYEDFRWYTEGMILSKETLPHAGYGIGNERVMQFILGVKDIRQCSIFSLMSEQTDDWNPSRRGILPMIEHRKTVLLSIGDAQQKQRLLPHVQKVKHNAHVFYTTMHTHDFLERQGVPTTLVHKISEEGKPNLSDLLRQDMFDLIINIPSTNTPTSRELSDGQLISKTALETGTTLVTDPDIAEALLMKLGERATLHYPVQ